MQYGISTSALYGRLETTDALRFLKSSPECQCVELFFQCPDDYDGLYSDEIRGITNGMNIVSMHMLSTMFEPMLYLQSAHGREYAQRAICSAIHYAASLGAKYYVFHGRNRMLSAKGGVLPKLTDMAQQEKALRPIIDALSEHGMRLAFENVYWSEFSYPGFGQLLANALPEVRFTLDIKQAARAGYDYHEYLAATGSRLAHVHAYDFDADGNVCLPGRGCFDFRRFGDELRAQRFDGAVIIEPYPYMYEEPGQLFESIAYIRRCMEG